MSIFFLFFVFLLAYKVLKFSLASQFLLMSVNFGSKLSSFILSGIVIGFPASSDECDESTVLDHKNTINFSLLDSHF